MSARPWHSALALALTGERLDLGKQERPDAAELVSELAARGWDRDRIEALARVAPVWPIPVEPADREGLGAAQWLAALREARRGLGLESLIVRPRSPRGLLNADERRLLADVPPHY